MRALRNWKEVTLFSLIVLSPRKGILFVAGLLATVICLLAFKFDPPNEVIFYAGAVLGALLSLYQLYFDYFKPPRLTFEPPRDLKLEILAKLMPSKMECLPTWSQPVEGAFKVVPDCSGEPALIRSDNFDRELRSGRWNPKLVVSVDRRKEVYAAVRSANAEEKIAILRAKANQANRLEKDFFNEDKIGIASPIESGADVEIFKSCYYITFLTNELATTVAISTPESGPPEYFLGGEVADRFPAKRTGSDKFQLGDFGEYLMGDHLGANIIAITKDDQMCLWQQGGGAIFSDGLLAPTGSGSCQWRDFDPHNPSLIATAKRGMLREFKEESVFSGAFKRKHSVHYEAHVIGFFRNLARAGLPGFVGIIKVDINASELQPDVREVVDPTRLGRTVRFPAGNCAELEASVDSLLNSADKHRGLSIPLIACLHSLRAALRECDSRIASILAWNPP